jgi:hypothetical protein
MIHVLGISIWIHFIWIFVLGVLLFFYLVHGTVFEGYQVGTGSSVATAFPLIAISSLPTVPVWLQRYQGSSGNWIPIGVSTDIMSYQDIIPKGGKLISSQGIFTLLFHTDGRLILYNSSVGVSSGTLPVSASCGSSSGSSCINGYPILWSFYTGNRSNYLFHQGSNGIRVINTDESLGSSPFSIIGSTSSNLNKSYLQLLDTGNLVWFAEDGSRLFHTNTAVTNLMTACGQIDFTSPLDQSDCFVLKRSLAAKQSDISTFTSSGAVLELNAAQKSICSIQAYYSALSCDAYTATVPVVTSIPPVGVLAPSASITGSIVNGTDLITTTGNLTTLVFPGYMIYLGYGTNIQGPFVAQTITASSIRITKIYVGAPISNAIISVKRSGSAATSTLRNTTPEVMQVSGLDIVASIFPGDRHIVIGSSTTSTATGTAGTLTTCGNAVDGGTITFTSPNNPFTGIESIYYGNPTGNCMNGFRQGSCNKQDISAFRAAIETACVGKTSCSINVTAATLSSAECSISLPTKTLAVVLSTAGIGDNLPENIKYGDFVYVHKSDCNPYDTDNGNGTCTARLCRIGEIDDLRGNCIPYSCKAARFTGGPADVDNGDGTCTSPTVYNNSTTITPLSLQTAPTTITQDISITLRNTNSQQYSTGGNTSFNTVILAKGEVYDKTRHGIKGTAYVKGSSNTAYTYNKTFGPFIVGARPTTNKLLIRQFTAGHLDSNGQFILNPVAKSRKDIINTGFSNDGKIIDEYTRTATAYSGTSDTVSLPEVGLLDAKLYKIQYNDGVFTGSFNSITAGTNALNEKLIKAIVTGTSGGSGIRQTGVNGKQIDLTGLGQVWDGTFNISGFSAIPGLPYTVSLTVSSSVDTYISLEYSTGNAYSIGTSQGSSLRRGSAPLLAGSGINNKFLVTPTKESYTWDIIAASASLAIHAYKIESTASVTFTFTGLTITGGIFGPVSQISCSNGSTTTKGVTVCNPSASAVAAGSAAAGSSALAASTAASAAAARAIACANGTAAAGACGEDSGSGPSRAATGSQAGGSASPLRIDKIQWAADAAAAAATNAGGTPDQVLAAAATAASLAGGGSQPSRVATLAQERVQKQITLK